MLRIVCITLVAVGCLAGGSSAWAGQTTSITARFTPDKLGSPTNASGEGKFVSTIPGEIPSPIIGFTIKGPAGLTLNLKGTTTCTAAILEGPRGPEGCPTNSIAGSGGGMGALKLGTQIIEEPFTLNFFLGDNRPSHTVILLYVNAVTPVSLQLVFTAVVEREAPPYGLGFHFNIPLIPTLPGASDASVLSAHVTIGAPNAYFYERVHGKRKRVHVKGLILPKTCPRGGFPVQSDISFEDGTTSENNIKVPCPKGKKR